MASASRPSSPLLLFPIAVALLALLLQWTPAPVAAASPRRCDKIALGETYSDRYDNVDVDAILNSQRLLKSYVECIMDRGTCTQEGCFLKAVIPDALSNECSKCNEKQKKIAGKILGFLLQNHRDTYWIDILNKFDPTGKFRKRYEWTDDDEDDPNDS